MKYRPNVRQVLQPVCSAAPVLLWKWHRASPLRWSLQVRMPACARPWSMLFIARICGSMRVRMWPVWKSAVRSKTSWPLPPVCAMACNSASMRAPPSLRGLAEMTRLGLALGAKAETFMGLSGLGDLVLTATGDLSRNRRIGLALAQGQSLEQAVQSLGHVAEGVYSARTVLQRADAAGVQMPITRCVVALLEGQLQATEAVAALMGREPAAEM